MVFARRALPCSFLSTLPGSASAVLASSPCGGCCFRFCVKIFKLSIRTFSYIPITAYVYKKPSGVEGRSESVQCESRWFEPRMALFFVVRANFTFFVGAVHLVTSVKICTMMIEVSSEQSRSQLYICIQSAAAAAAAAALCVAILLSLLQQRCCCFLLLFVIVCWIAKFGAGSLNLIPVFSFSSFKRDLFLMYTLAVLCRIHGLDFPTSSAIAGMRGVNAGVSPPR